MPSPQPKSNELLNKIKPSLMSGSKLVDDITLRSVINQARKLPDIGERYLVEGLANFVKGDTELGINLCESAISCDPNNRIVWSNYLIALLSWGRHEQAMLVARRGSQTLMPILLVQCFELMALWAEKDSLNEISKRMHPFIRSVSLEPAIAQSIRTAEATMAKLNKISEESSSELMSMAEAAREIADKERLQVVNSSIVDEFDGGYAFRVGIQTDDYEYLAKLDDMLFDLLISNGVKSRDCIVYFEPIEVED